MFILFSVYTLGDSQYDWEPFDTDPWEGRPYIVLPCAEIGESQNEVEMVMWATLDGPYEGRDGMYEVTSTRWYCRV